MHYGITTDCLLPKHNCGTTRYVSICMLRVWFRDYIQQHCIVLYTVLASFPGPAQLFVVDRKRRVGLGLIDREPERGYAEQDLASLHCVVNGELSEVWKLEKRTGSRADYCGGWGSRLPLGYAR